MDRQTRTLRLAIMHGKPIDDLVQCDRDKLLALNLIYEHHRDKEQKYTKFLEKDITAAQRFPLAIQARDWETVVALDHLLPEHLELLEGELQKAINSGWRQSDDPRFHELVVTVAASRSNWDVVQSLGIRKEESQRILSKLANRFPDRQERLRLLRSAALADMCVPDERALIKDLVELFYENPEENLKCLKKLSPRHRATLEGLLESASAILVDIFKCLKVLPRRAQGASAERFVRFALKVSYKLEDLNIGIIVLGSLWEYAIPVSGASFPSLIEDAYERCSQERGPNASDVFRDLEEGQATADLLVRAVLAKDHIMADWLIQRRSFLDDAELRHLDALYSRASLTGIMRAEIVSERDIDGFMRYVWQRDDSSRNSVRQVLQNPDQQGLDRDLQARLYSSLFKLRNDWKIEGLQKLLEWGWNPQFLIDFAIRQDEDRPVCFLLDRFWPSRLELSRWFGVAVTERSYRVAVCLLAKIVRLSAASRPTVPKLASSIQSTPIGQLTPKMIGRIFDHLSSEDVWLASATSKKWLSVGVDYLLTRSTIVEGRYEQLGYFQEDGALCKKIEDDDGLHFIGMDNRAAYLRVDIRCLEIWWINQFGYSKIIEQTGFFSSTAPSDIAVFQKIEDDQVFFKQIKENSGRDLTRFNGRQAWLRIGDTGSIYPIPKRILTSEGESARCNSADLLCCSLSGVIWSAESVCDILHELDELDSKEIRGAVQRLLYNLHTTSDVLSGDEDTIRVMVFETFSTTTPPAVYDSQWAQPFAPEQSLSSLLLQKLIEA